MSARSLLIFVLVTFLAGPILAAGETPDVASRDFRWLPTLEFGGKAGSERHLWEIDANISRQQNPGSEAGHMVLRATNAVRTPFHGWIIQSEGLLSDQDDGVRLGMWARVLAKSTANFDPGLGSVVFDDD